mmetsp:Transcript_15889/g.42988  ORF Transcript_15889/g.42988 Transcript_15889/m.42988 type:complete len:204 (-) Transcript_15889:424-1035(-)
MLTGTYASVLSTPVGPPHPLPHHARPAVSTEMLTLPALRCSSMWCSRAHAARPPGCPSSSPAPPTNSPTNWSPSGASSSRPSTTRRLPLTPSSATSRRAGTARASARPWPWPRLWRRAQPSPRGWPSRTSRRPPSPPSTARTTRPRACGPTRSARCSTPRGSRWWTPSTATLEATPITSSLETGPPTWTSSSSPIAPAPTRAL